MINDLSDAYRPYLYRTLLHSGSVAFYFYRRFHSRVISATKAFRLCSRLTKPYYNSF